MDSRAAKLRIARMGYGRTLTNDDVDELIGDNDNLDDLLTVREDLCLFVSQG